ncbi:MAG: 30S ribosomal protein S19 [Candidatus Diapherotrites archaeon]
MAKQFTFRGKTIEELNALSIEEFSKLVTSRARRTLKRKDFKKFLKKIEKARQAKAGGKDVKPVKTHRRDTIVVPAMVGLKVGIHAGKEFQTVEITEKMLGHFLGEFALTRKRLLHGKAGIGATRSSTALVSARG